MESFKLVIDGIDLTKEDRKRIEKGIERAMVEALAGKTKGMVFRPVIHRDGAAKGRKADGAAESLESDEFGQIAKLLPNGGILLRELMAQKEAEQVKDSQFSAKARFGETLSISEILHSSAPGNVGTPGQSGGFARPA